MKLPKKPTYLVGSVIVIFIVFLFSNIDASKVQQDESSETCFCLKNKDTDDRFLLLKECVYDNPELEENLACFLPPDQFTKPQIPLPSYCESKNSDSKIKAHQRCKIKNKIISNDNEWKVIEAGKSGCEPCLYMPKKRVPRGE